MGPLTVRPDYQRRGVGGALLRHTLTIAGKLGYRAVFLFGSDRYYPRFGFRRADAFGVATAGGGTPGIYGDRAATGHTEGNPGVFLRIPRVRAR